MREQIARGLESARGRTLHLTDIDEPELTAQHSPLMSPLVWDLAHIGQQEDLWLLRGGNAAAQGLLSCQIEKLYDAFEHPRATRASLPLLSPNEARGFLHDVRGRVLDGLDEIDEASPDQLFPYVMVEQHEQQHVETMLATHQLRDGAPMLGAGVSLPRGRVVPAGSVLVPAGPFSLGVDLDDEPWSLDNERPAHTVDLPAFRIARAPVSNGEWQAFIDAGGYDEPRWWSQRGWRHRVDAGLARPLFWAKDGSRRRFGRRAGAAHLLLRGRGVRRLGRRTPAHRAGVGEGVRLGPGCREPTSLAMGSRGLDDGSRQPRRGSAAPSARGRIPGGSVRLRRRADDG
jgi:iron(II)-dependent oxidoreductase